MAGWNTDGDSQVRLLHQEQSLARDCHMVWKFELNKLSYALLLVLHRVQLLQST